MFPSRRQARTGARALGWFSIGLGVLELVAGRHLARAVGAGSGLAAERVVRANGLREIALGVGLLAFENKRPWLWARVAGDALDMALLAPGLAGAHRQRTAVALAAVAGVTAVDVVCARAMDRPPPPPSVDYSGRSGLPLPAEEMRGAAVADFEAPADMRTPTPLRPYLNGSPASRQAEPARVAGTVGIGEG